jgi:hypothetical protein
METFGMNFAKKGHTEYQKFSKMEIKQHSDKTSATHILYKIRHFAIHYIYPCN